MSLPALLSVPLLVLSQPPAGSNLTLAGARQLEESLKAEPNDLSARTKLLAYYFRNGRRDLAPKEWKEVRRVHILWLIEHHPENRMAGAPEASIDTMSDPEGYVQAAAAWRKVTSKPDVSPSVLANAARFFTLPDIEFAAELLQRALKANPNDQRISADLAHNYKLQAHRAKDEPGRAALAKKAFDQMEAAARLAAAPRDRSYLLPDLARLALDAGEPAKARSYAVEMLELAGQSPESSSSGHAVHYGNLVLGRLALRGGEIEKAKQHLLASGKTRGASTLSSFGPNMTLARELLLKGERDVVVQYLDLCGEFWKSNRGKLDEWKATIRGGGIPDFGANLLY